MEPLKRRLESSEYFGGEKAKPSGYLQNSSVHGVKYVAFGGKCQRIFWLSAVSVSAFALIFLLVNSSAVHEMKAKRPIFETPFPAITICPETKANKSVVDFTEAYHNLVYKLADREYDESDLSRVEALTQVCDQHLFSSMKISETPTPGADILSTLRELSVPQSEIFLFCKFNNELVDCGELFEEIVIDDGICYTFNAIDGIFGAKEHRYAANASGFSLWSRDGGYACAPDKFDRPRRALSGYNYGLNVVLNQHTSNLDFMCRGPVQGFKVRVHAPDEVPNMRDGFFRIPLNADIIASVSAGVARSESECHTKKSKPLRFFSEYSHKNCIAECLSDFVEKACNCTKFSMVRGSEGSVCTQHDTKCVVEATDTFFIDSRLKQKFPCDCRPACVDLRYDFRTSSATFDFKRVFKAYNASVDEEFPASMMSRLNVYVKNDFYSDRVGASGKLSSILRHISAVGGILAFFLGASVLSVVEIVYFALCRICFFQCCT